MYFYFVFYETHQILISCMLANIIKKCFNFYTTFTFTFNDITEITPTYTDYRLYLTVSKTHFNIIGVKHVIFFFNPTLL